MANAGSSVIRLRKICVEAKTLGGNSVVELQVKKAIAHFWCTRTRDLRTLRLKPQQATPLTHRRGQILATIRCCTL